MKFSGRDVSIPISTDPKLRADFFMYSNRAISSSGPRIPKNSLSAPGRCGSRRMKYFLTPEQIEAVTDVQSFVRGKTVVCVVSGGNFDFERLPEVKERAQRCSGVKKYFILRLPQRPTEHQSPLLWPMHLPAPERSLRHSTSRSASRRSDPHSAP